MLGRFLVRGCETNKNDKGETGATIIGFVKFNNDNFKPGHVYEIRQILGEFDIVDLGSSHVPDNHMKASLNDLVGIYGKRLFLSKSEFDLIEASRKNA